MAKKSPHQVQRLSDPLSEDTCLEIERKQLEIFRSMSAAQKTELIIDAAETSKAIAMAGLRERHPGADQAELLYRYVALVHGEDLASRAYGPLDRKS